MGIVLINEHYEMLVQISATNSQEVQSTIFPVPFMPSMFLLFLFLFFVVFLNGSSF